MERRPDPIRQRVYRFTKWMVVPASIVTLGAAWEIYALLFKLEGGPFSHLAWWAYGGRYSLQWWLLSSTFTAWSVWCCWHFAYRWPGLPHLLALVGAGLLVGLVGWILS